MKVALVMFLAFCAVFAFADILICSSCGYENDSGSYACSHCKENFSSSSKPAKDFDAEERNDSREPIEAVRSDGKFYLPLSVVDKDITVALEYLRSSSSSSYDDMTSSGIELARLFLVNASAINTIVEPELRKKRAEKIFLYIKNCEERLAMVRKKCQICKGTGKKMWEPRSITGTSTKIKISTVKCLNCRGKGYVRRYGLNPDRKFGFAKARNKYESMQQARGYVTVGSAWIPEDAKEQISVKQVVSLKKASVPPCSECFGTGQGDCRSCSGAGDVKCEEDGCEKGKITMDNGTTATINDALKGSKRACAVCEGTGYVPCEDCRGRGGSLCKKCEGSGKKDECTKCDGEGLESCRRCRGSGKYKDLSCDTCGGKGLAECTGCKGDGRK